MDELTGKDPKKLARPNTTQPQDRATLAPVVAVKIDAWIKQINEKYIDMVTVSRSDLVNYFLSKLPDDLNRDQLEKIKTAHFDEVRFAQWALRKLKDSKKKGEALSLKDVLSMSRPTDGDKPKRAKPPKSAESDELVPIGGENSVKKFNGNSI